MNNMKYIFVVLLACLTFASCSKYENSAEPSTVTFLPKITLSGPSVIDLPCDTEEYNASGGASATVLGNPVDVSTSISSKYFGGDVNGPDTYFLNFTAVNDEGIPFVEAQRINWPECNGDLVNSIAGNYTAYLSRTNGDGVVLATPQYQGVGPIIIRDLGNNEYAISDVQGGWYEYGRALGTPYATLGQTITANDIPSNDFTYGPTVETNTFAGVNTLQTFTVDPATKTIEWSVYWEYDFTFDVRLVQND